MSTVRLEDHRWPLLTVHWPRGELTAEDVDTFIRRADEYLDRREPFVVVHNASFSVRPSATIRAKLAAHIERQGDAMSRYIKAAGVVTASALVRGAVTAINWISPAPFPQRTFANLESAEQWVLAELERTQS